MYIGQAAKPNTMFDVFKTLDAGIEVISSKYSLLTVTYTVTITRHDGNEFTNKNMVEKARPRTFSMTLNSMTEKIRSQQDSFLAPIDYVAETTRLQTTNDDLVSKIAQLSKDRDAIIARIKLLK
jgi:hypothetical protein